MSASNDDEFTGVSLFSVPPEEVLPFDVAIYYKGRFVIYRKAGQVIEVSKYNRFIFKRISKLFIPNADVGKYKEFAKVREAGENQKLNDPKLSTEQKVVNQTIHKLNSATQELFAASDEDYSTNQAKIITVARASVETICDRPYIRIFDSIPATSAVVPHSMRVSLISAFLGYQLGFVNQISLENLAAAGMLHDIGKTRLNLSDDLEVSEASEAEFMKLHVSLSVKVLRQGPSTPEEVIRIVSEHHEMRDGSGYPSQVRGPKMHALSKVFTIANAFDNLVSRQTGDRLARAKAASQIMQKDMRAQFDPLLLPKALKLLVNPG